MRLVSRKFLAFAQLAAGAVAVVTALAPHAALGDSSIPAEQYHPDFKLVQTGIDAYDNWEYTSSPAAKRDTTNIGMPMNLLFYDNANIDDIYYWYEFDNRIVKWTCGGGSTKWGVWRDANYDPNYSYIDDASGIKQRLHSSCDGNTNHMRLYAKGKRNGYNAIWGYWVFGEAHQDYGEDNKPNDQYGFNEAAELAVVNDATTMWGSTRVHWDSHVINNHTGVPWSDHSPYSCEAPDEKHYLCSNGFSSTFDIP